MHPTFPSHEDLPPLPLPSRTSRCLGSIVSSVVAVALALSFLAPAAKAAEISNFTKLITHVFSGSLGNGGQGADIATTWNPPPPAAPLESIMVQVAFSSDISVANANPLGFPVNDTFISWTPQVIVSLPNGGVGVEVGSNQSVFKTGPGTVAASGRFDETLMLNFSGPALDGANPLSVDMITEVDTGTQFGDGTHQANFEATVIYNVPDGGSTLLWLVPAMALLVMGRRRRVDSL